MKPTTVRVGLLGLGTVGAGVAAILGEHGAVLAGRTGIRLQVTRALVRSKRRKRPVAARGVALTTKPEDILEADDIDIVAELMGGIEPAVGYIGRALRAGTPVVTANKAVLADHARALHTAAHEGNSDLYYEAAVAGGIPIIRTLQQGLVADRIEQISGILNGTTNYMLGRLADGEAYDQVLRTAQELGYAEADPTLDVGGGDAAAKLAILMQLAFGLHVPVDAIPTAGIDDLGPEVLADARRVGCSVKLIAHAGRTAGGRVDAWVQPTFVPIEHPLANIPGAYNAIAVDSEALGTSLLQGPGAGGLPTGSAVVSDLIDAARNLKAGIHGRVRLGPDQTARGPQSPARSGGAFYLRLLVKDEPGVLATVAKVLARHGISLASVFQDPGAGPAPVAVALITHPTTAGAMAKAMTKIRALSALVGHPNVLRVMP